MFRTGWDALTAPKMRRNHIDIPRYVVGCK
jgi:hypothetical protein